VTVLPASFREQKISPIFGYENVASIGEIFLAGTWKNVNFTSPMNITRLLLVVAVATFALLGSAQNASARRTYTAVVPPPVPPPAPEPVVSNS
jgi:hypothetical protein